MAGCTEQVEKIVYENPSLPTVSIEQVGQATDSGVTLRFIQSGKGAGFDYTVGQPADRVAFEDGSLASIVSISESGQKDIVVDGLTHASSYTVFARSFDEEGVAGPVAQIIFTTEEDILQTNPLVPELQYTTSSSVAITVDPADNYYKFEYALGTPSGKDAFENGSLAGIITQEQNSKFVIPFFGLEAGKDYVFYMRAYDRTGRVSKTIETAVATKAAGRVPEVSMTTDYCDIYKGKYTFTPNSECGQFGVLICHNGGYDGIFYSKYNYNGDILGRMIDYMAAPSWSNPLKTAEGEPVSLEYITEEMELELGLEAWVMLYDKAGEPFGIQRIETRTPSFDASAGTAAIESAEFTSIATWYCPYTCAPNEHTLITFISIWDADEFEAERDSPDNVGTYLQELAYEKSYDSYLGAYRFIYGNESFSGSVGYGTGRYYLVFLPVNANGPRDGGWGELKALELVIP